MSNVSAASSSNSPNKSNIWSDANWQLFRGADTAKKVAVVFGIGLAVGLVEIHLKLFILGPIYKNIFVAQSFSQFKDQCLLRVQALIAVYKCLSIIVKNLPLSVLAKVSFNAIMSTGFDALIEEVLFRLGLQNILKNLGNFWHEKKLLGIELKTLMAIFISALIFGYLHKTGGQQFLSTIGGITDGFLFEYYGLFCAVVSHTTNNVVAYSVLSTVEIAEKIVESSKS